MNKSSYEYSELIKNLLHHNDLLSFYESSEEFSSRIIDDILKDLNDLKGENYKKLVFYEHQYKSKLSQLLIPGIELVITLFAILSLSISFNIFAVLMSYIGIIGFPILLKKTLEKIRNMDIQIKQGHNRYRELKRLYGIQDDKKREINIRKLLFKSETVKAEIDFFISKKYMHRMIIDNINKQIASIKHDEVIPSSEYGNSKKYVKEIK